MNEFDFTGPLKEEMSEFILLKRTVGNKYNSEVGVLKRFDRYLEQKYPTITGLPKEVVTGWCTKQPYEKPANQCSRASVIRQFAKYLDDTGHKAFVLPDNYYPSGPQYVPHIYSQDELQRFFAETDRCHFCYECPWRHLVMPVFFRLLFECGLRCSEARLLTVGDVDLDKGCLTILESKNHNSRLVMVSASMLKRLREYADAVHTFPDESAFFFPGSPGKPMTLGNVYKNFRRFLWQARIPHTGDGPRVHDFRYPNLNKIPTLAPKRCVSCRVRKKRLGFSFIVCSSLSIQRRTFPWTYKTYGITIPSFLPTWKTRATQNSTWHGSPGS